MDTIIKVLMAVGDIGLFALIQSAVKRRRQRKDILSTVMGKLDKIELDSCRTQLLVMISDYSDDQHEILRLAEHYFVDLKGNWNLTSIFHKWLDKNNIENPVWFSHEN